jgi:hypothetical protein
MEIVISLVALAVACLIWLSATVDYVLANLSDLRPRLVPRPTFFVCYHHIKNCLTGKPFEYGELWIRKSPGHAR